MGKFWPRRFFFHIFVWFLFIYLPIAGIGLVSVLQDRHLGAAISDWDIASHVFLAIIPAILAAMGVHIKRASVDGVALLHDYIFLSPHLEE